MRCNAYSRDIRPDHRQSLPFTFLCDVTIPRHARPVRALSVVGCTLKRFKGGALHGAVTRRATLEWTARIPSHIGLEQANMVHAR